MIFESKSERIKYMLDIAQLKSKWEKEKPSYIKKEIGDGVQMFVKDVLKSPEVFNLKEGLNSTKLENRTNEFKEEESKKSGHADVVIFINSDIVIPMEIEKLQNIVAGEKQIIQYQLDWNEHSNRRYGILTDGYVWRFYNNNEYREFALDDIIKKTEMFLEFWQEYIKPETYYLSFFEKKGQRSLFKETETLHVEEYRQTFFEDITKFIKGFKNKLQIEGYLKELAVKDKGKTAVEITYAYIIQFILYKTLVDNEFSKFQKEFIERQEEIYKCLKGKRYGDILGIIDGISSQISKNIYRPFAKEQEFINSKLSDLIRQPKKELHDVSPWLDIFVFIKKYNFANVKNEIFGYIYENYLKELYEDTKKGQYFTDPAVVNFMLEQVGYTPSEIQKRLNNNPEEKFISIIDPSCGSGTFLYSAVDQIMKSVPNGSEDSSEKIEELVNKNVFGLDIAEFPLYLAEMNMVMRMLPLIINETYNNPVDKKIKVFKTRDSIAEFQDTAIKNTISDIEVAYAKSNGQLSLFTKQLNLGYSSYVRDEDDLQEMKKSLENQKFPRRRFDFVIGNPPYVSFKECSKQKVLFFALMKQKKIKLSDIYGVNLHSTPSNHKKYAPNPNLYAFFIALGLALLKDNGRLCYIIPQTILTAGDLDVLRYYLAKFTTIDKIITFSGKMFVGRGLKQNKPVATSSLIFVVKKAPPDLGRHEVEVIHYKDADDDIEDCLKNILENKKVSKKNISQGKLLQNVSNWNFIKQGKIFLDFYESYKKNTDDISIYYNHAAAAHNFKSKFYFDRGLKYPKDKIKKSTTNIDDGYSIANYNKNGFTANASENFIGRDLLDFPFGSQGASVFEQKYKIVWSYINYDHFRFSGDKVMIDYNNVLISSDNKQELLYLLSIFNSRIVTKIFDALLRNENEKDILIGIKTIKEFVRISKITENSQPIKNEIIKRTEEMLELEYIKLTDLVDFSKIMMQKLDRVEVNGDDLVLIKNSKEIKCKIKRDNKLVKQAVTEKFFNSGLLKDKDISLVDIQDLAVIDFEKQKSLKDYTDDLVFALYFNVRISKVGLGEAKNIKAKCEENKFYKII